MRSSSDETYVIDLCNRVLNRQAKRQFAGFEFLRGDCGRNGTSRRLPVDAYYEDLRLVVEFWERQHTAAVPIMDQKQTISGCTRRDQRRIYDQRRKEMLPMNGLTLIILDYTKFRHDGKGRLIRNLGRDEQIVRESLSKFLCGIASRRG